jgi:hypothetical protein
MGTPPGLCDNEDAVREAFQKCEAEDWDEGLVIVGALPAIEFFFDRIGPA